MKRATLCAVAWVVSCAAAIAAAGDLAFSISGGQSLTVRAKAEQQEWRLFGKTALVAAVVDGKLIVREFVLPFDSSPQPDPTPEPQPDPDPQPQPQPGPKTVLWIEESADRTPGRATAVIDAAIRAAIQKAGWSLRIVDVDVVDENGRTPPDLAPYISSAKAAGLPRVFILRDGMEIFSGIAPPDAPSFRTLLSRFGLPVEVSAKEAETFNRVLKPVETNQGAGTQEKEEKTNQATQSQGAACPTGQCPTQTAPTNRRWRLVR